MYNSDLESAGNYSVKGSNFSVEGVYQKGSLVGEVEGSCSFKIVPDFGGVEVDVRSLKDALDECGHDYGSQTVVLDSVSIDGDMSLVGDASGLFSNFEDISGLEYLDTSKVTNMNSMFSDCSMKSIDLSGFDTHNVTGMTGMFYGSSSLENLDISSFDSGSLVDASFMFNGCENLESINFGSFNFVNLVDDLHGVEMFGGCNSLTDVAFKDIPLRDFVDMCRDFEDAGVNLSEKAHLDCDMLANDDTVLSSQIRNDVSVSSGDYVSVSWEDGNGYVAGNTLMDVDKAESRILSVEDVDSKFVFSSKDVSLVGNGQVLGDSFELSKNSGDLGE